MSVQSFSQLEGQKFDSFLWFSNSFRTVTGIQLEPRIKSSVAPIKIASHFRWPQRAANSACISSFNVVEAATLKLHPIPLVADPHVSWSLEMPQLEATAHFVITANYLHFKHLEVSTFVATPTTWHACSVTPPEIFFLWICEPFLRDVPLEFA